jgi:peptide/nickel transport system permease protein
MEIGVARKRRSKPVDFFARLVKEKPLGTIGAVVVVILLLTGIFANLLAPYGENQFVLEDRLQPPSLHHPLGTDNLGRDLLSRIIFGARISMVVGMGGSVISVTVATIIGLASGFFGGAVDIAVQRFVDAFMCFPGLVLYLSVMSILGPGLVQVIFVLGVTGGIHSSRVVRGAVISIKNNTYMDAAGAIGASPLRILARHILPNVMAPIIILFTVAMGAMIISEAMLSFLGFGIPPPAASWGGMLSDKGRAFMFAAPWMALWPGLALAVAVYGINMLGDAMRDLLDPRLRGGLGRYEGAKIKTSRARTAKSS